MTSPAWLVADLLAWKKSTPKSADLVRRVCGGDWAPNLSDVGSAASLFLADHVLKQLGITRQVSSPNEQEQGAKFEREIEAELRQRLAETSSGPRMTVRRRDAAIHRFGQYRHLDELQQLLSDQPTLRTAFGTDYEIAPDVVVSYDRDGVEHLHAVVSCKWTLRSDRAQNVRQEFNLLIRERRGRTPHLVAVTAEPLPSRLASLTRGTGEIDAIYHVTFDELAEAVAHYDSLGNDRGSPTQRECWEEMTGQRRLKDFGQLAYDLATT